jgi:hypothetical protein
MTGEQRDLPDLRQGVFDPLARVVEQRSERVGSGGSGGLDPAVAFDCRELAEIADEIARHRSHLGQAVRNLVDRLEDVADITPQAVDEEAHVGRLPDSNLARGDAAVTFPDPPVVAVLPGTAVPVTPPDSLMPYVVRAQTASGPDWILTDDAIAFGVDLVVQHYLAWRSTWVRELELDPLTSLLVLADVLDDGETAARWGTDWVAGRATAVSDPALLTACLGVANETIAARAHTGWGVLNATPGRPTMGLARSPACGSHVLAATSEVRVTIEREAGVCVHLDDPSDDRRRDHDRGEGGRRR